MDLAEARTASASSSRAEANGAALRPVEDSAPAANGVMPSPQHACVELALGTGELAGARVLTPRLLQQHLREAAGEVDRVIQDTRLVTHEAYAQLEAQSSRLMPLEGKLGEQCRGLNSQDSNGGAELQHNQLDMPNGHGRSLEENLQGSLSRIGSMQRSELADSVGVLEHEMAQLVDLAAGGEQAAGEVARLRQSLHGICAQLGAFREYGAGARAVSPKVITNGLLPQDFQKLEATVKELWEKVLHLTASGEHTSAEFADMQEQFSNIREAMLALHSHVAMRDDVQRALTLLREEFLSRPHLDRVTENLHADEASGSTSTVPADVMLGPQLMDAGSALQEEWAQLLDLGLARLHAESDPNDSGSRAVGSQSSTDIRQLTGLGTEGAAAAASEQILQGIRQEFAGALENMQVELAQVSLRCDQAVGHARETGRDVDRLRDELREELAAPSLELRFATKHEVTELGEHLHGSLRGCEACLRQELGNVREHIMQRPRPAMEEAPHRGVSKDDLAEVREQLRQESVELISQKHDGANQVSKQELGRNVQSIMEELERLTDRVGNCEKVGEEVGKQKKDTRRLFEQLNILKDQNDVVGEEAKELTGSIAQLEARLSQVEGRKPQCAEPVPQEGPRGVGESPLSEHSDKDYVPHQEFEGAIHAVMDECISAQKLGMCVREDLDAVAKAVETLRMRNSLLGEEVKKLMDALDGSVQSLKEDLAEAIAELRRRAAREQALKPREVSESPADVKTKVATQVDALLESRLENFSHEITEAHAILKADLLELREEARGKSAQSLRQELNTEIETSLHSFREELKSEMQQIRLDLTGLHMVAESISKPMMAESNNEATTDAQKGFALRRQNLQRLSAACSEEIHQTVDPQVISEAVERARSESAAARSECGDLRQMVNVLTAKLIADRSMVTAGVAAAMAVYDRNSEMDSMASNSQKHSKDLRENAAVKIQSIHRGSHLRKQQKAAVHEKALQEKERAAVKVQSVYRGSLLRKQREALVKATKDVTAVEKDEDATAVEKDEEEDDEEEEEEEDEEKDEEEEEEDEEEEAVRDKASSVATQMTEKLSAGSTVVTVADTSGFAVGDPIMISSSAGTELNEVAGFSSIRLRYPTKYEHPVGTTLKKLLPGDPQLKEREQNAGDGDEERPPSEDDTEELEEEEEEEEDTAAPTSRQVSPEGEHAVQFEEGDKNDDVDKDQKVVEAVARKSVAFFPEDEIQICEGSDAKPKIQITIVGARGLQLDDEEESLVYCICRPHGDVDEQRSWSFQTPMVRKVAEPIWNCIHKEEADLADQAIEFSIWEREAEEDINDWASECHGKCVLQTSQFWPDGFDDELVLQDTEEDVSITLHIRLIVMGVDGTSLEMDDTEQVAQSGNDNRSSVRSSGTKASDAEVENVNRSSVRTSVTQVPGSQSVGPQSISPGRESSTSKASDSPRTKRLSAFARAVIGQLRRSKKEPLQA